MGPTPALPLRAQLSQPVGAGYDPGDAQGGASTAVGNPPERQLPEPSQTYMAMALPATPAGQVYQLWVADDTGVHALGTFHFDGQGAFVAPFGVDLGDSAAAMVTREPEGGAQGEPGPQVVFGEI